MTQPKIIVKGEWETYAEYRALWNYELKKQIKEKKEKEEEK